MQKSRNIGFDIDGCMNNFTKYIIDICCKELSNTVPQSVLDQIDTTKYYIKDVFAFDDSICKKAYQIFQDSLLDIYRDIEMRPYCSNCITNLQSRGNNIHIVTHRNEMLSSDVTIAWLNHGGVSIPRDNIHFVKDKAATCKKLNIDIMMEDVPEVIDELKMNDVNYVIYDNVYNKKNIGRRVRLWNEYDGMYMYVNGY